MELKTKKIIIAFVGLLVLMIFAYVITGVIVRKIFEQKNQAIVIEQIKDPVKKEQASVKQPETVYALMKFVSLNEKELTVSNGQDETKMVLGENVSIPSELKKGIVVNLGINQKDSVVKSIEIVK